MVAPIEAESTLVAGNSAPLFAGPYRQIAVNSPRSYDIASDGQRFLMLKPIVVADERDETAVILNRTGSRNSRVCSPATRMPLTPGTTLGPYEIQAPLGAGGMGEVYKATDTRLDRTVAIKVLPAHVASDPDLKKRRRTRVLHL